MEKGKWVKGENKYLAVDGMVYDVNPENGIFKDCEGVRRKAGSWRPENERHLEVEVKGDFTTTKQMDDASRVYESSAIRTKGKKE